MTAPILASCAEIVATLAISAPLLDVAGALQQALGDGGRGRVDAALERHRVRPGRDGTQSLVHHRLGQHGRRRGAVAGHVVGLGGDFLGELSTQVLLRVLQLDLLGDGHAVVGDGRSAPLLVDDDIAATRAERHLHGVRELVDAPLKRPPRVLIEIQALGHEAPQLIVLLWMVG